MTILDSLSGTILKIIKIGRKYPEVMSEHSMDYDNFHEALMIVYNLRSLILLLYCYIDIVIFIVMLCYIGFVMSILSVSQYGS